MDSPDSKKSQKVARFFECLFCDYKSSNKYDYMKHLATLKHKNCDNGSKMVVNGSTLSQKIAKYNCECGRTYKYDSGYYRHKKKCSSAILLESNETTDKDLIMMLIKQNSQLLEVIKNGTNNTTTNSNNINSNNKTFNLQFFLNETCKDAMNITDFVDSIKLQLSDLENVGKLGYVEGISNIITTNLKALDVTQRPVHCTDKKREVLYIKDENKWQKEDDDKKRIKRAIKRVVSKNQRLLPKFKEAHPDCVKASSLFSDQYNKIIIESMGGSGDNDVEKEDKIIKNITKATSIEKN
jgi:transcription elongation factor Elf1